MKLCTRMKFDGKIVGVALVIATAGCTGTAVVDGESSVVASEQSACVADEQAQKADQHGPLALISHALSKTCLSDEQRATVERMGTVVSEQENKVAEARRNFRHELLAQFRSGHIDACSLDDEVDALVRAREAASPTLRKAFEDLHDMLDPSQRTAFVDAIKSRIKEKREAAKPMLDDLARDLDLTAEQKEQIHAVLEKAKEQREEERSTFRNVLKAFTEDKFSMEEIAPVADVGEKTRARATRMIATAEEITGILTAEQREQLAQRIMARHRGKAACEEPAPATEMTDEGPALASAQIGGEPGGADPEVFVARGYRAGYVNTWGPGGVGYVRGGAYVGGYPIAPYYGPGVW
ncbi:MAG: Spy/CpxP family protein refolding chaperone [Labilithrix sp.]|nr:Spy/CpxP family protein refolding chaperone [Labilithrix sp.]